MSGGSYDYVYSRIRDAADAVRRSVADHPTDTIETRLVYDRVARRSMSPEDSAAVLAAVDAERLWLAGLMEIVSEAMHDIEWVDSCDMGPGDEVAAIRKVRAYMAGGAA